MYRERLFMTVSDTDGWNELCAIVDEPQQALGEQGMDAGDAVHAHGWKVQRALP
jgi:hypothetical protein